MRLLQKIHSSGLLHFFISISISSCCKHCYLYSFISSFICPARSPPGPRLSVAILLCATSSVGNVYMTSAIIIEMTFLDGSIISNDIMKHTDTDNFADTKRKFQQQKRTHKLKLAISSISHLTFNR